MRTRCLAILIIGSITPTIRVPGAITHTDDVKITTSGGVTMLEIEADDYDSTIRFLDPGDYWFSLGIDESDAGTFKIFEGGDFASNRGISIRTNGQVGIGTSTPNSLLNVSAGTAGDAVLTLEADTDNSNENDNPRVEFFQDGALVSAMVGFREEGESTNLFRISAYQPSSPVYDAITIDPFTRAVEIGGGQLTVTSNERVGIGTDNPISAFDVGDSFYARTGYIVIRPQDSTNEGGQVIFQGAASNPNWNIDAYADRLRIFNSVERMTISASGNVGIATASPSYKLDVNGSAHASSLVIDGNVGIGTSVPGNKLEVNGVIRSKEVIVESTGWPDDVFRPGYELAPLSAIERHITDHGHLPGVPSETQAAAGVRVGDMQQILLRKVEELTLHLIKQEKKIDALESDNQALREALSIP